MKKYKFFKNFLNFTNMKIYLKNTLKYLKTPLAALLFTGDYTFHIDRMCQGICSLLLNYVQIVVVLPPPPLSSCLYLCLSCLLLLLVFAPFQFFRSFPLSTRLSLSLYLFISFLCCLQMQAVNELVLILSHDLVWPVYIYTYSRFPWRAFCRPSTMSIDQAYRECPYFSALEVRMYIICRSKSAFCCKHMCQVF